MKIFSPDSMLIRFLSIVADVVFVNLLYLVCCIPILTIGPARAALLSVGRKWAKRVQSGGADFIKAFLGNFRSTFPHWIPVLLSGVLLVFGIWVTCLNELPMELLLWFLICPVTVLYLMMYSQFFMLEAHFTCTFMQCIKFNLLSALGHPLRSVAVLVIQAVPVLVFLWQPALFTDVSLLWFFVYFSLDGFMCANLLSKPFERLLERFGIEEPEEEKNI